MESQAPNNRVKSILIEDLSDLMEELSDEEAGACVGGMEIKTPLLSSMIDPLLSFDINAEVLNIGIGADTYPRGSARVSWRG